jgi:hypothetical protein
MKHAYLVISLIFGAGTSVLAVDLINIDYTAHLNPFFASKTGPAVVGNTVADQWNVYSRDVSSPFDWRTDGTLSPLLYSDGANSGASLAVFNAPGAWYTLSPEPMYMTYLYPFNGGSITSQFSDIPAGTYDIYVYAHGQPSAENGVLTLSIGATGFGTLSTSPDASLDTPGFTEGFEYVVYRNIPVVLGDRLDLISSPGSTGLAIMNGVQIVTAGTALWPDQGNWTGTPVPDGGSLSLAALAWAAMLARRRS